MQEEYGQIYANLYHHHWWWRTRERIVLETVGRLDLPDHARIMDVGCGDGLLLPKLAVYGEVSGLEIDTSLVHKDNPYRQRIYSQPLGSKTYRAKQFDLITSLDVIEHIGDDDKAVGHMMKMLDGGGHLLITVPAFMALWDEHDEINLHYRRYTAASLRRLLEPYGRVVEMRYLFHSLFLPKLAVRWLNRFRKNKVAQHHMPGSGTNERMMKWCMAEYRLAQWLRIPFGTSLMALVEKPIEVPAIMPYLAAA